MEMTKSLVINYNLNFLTINLKMALFIVSLTSFMHSLEKDLQEDNNIVTIMEFIEAFFFFFINNQLID